jgi:hypothetical protein
MDGRTTHLKKESNMFTITVVFGNVSASLLYRDKDRAMATWEKVSKRTQVDRYPLSTADEMILKDEYGREVFLPLNMLYGAIFENMQETAEALIESAMHNARTQARVQKRATTDPELRAAQMAAGPSVLTPMGGMNGRFS